MRLIPDWIWGVMTLMQEVQGESFNSKVAVAEVILRRTRMKYSSDGTVAGTVLWPLQFSGWNAQDATPKYRERIECAKIDDQEPVVQECIKAWKMADQGSNLTNGAYLYFNPKICSPSWASKCIEVARIDDHVFMVEKRRKEA